MKPLEMLTALPGWAGAKPDAIVDSPAFAFQGRIGENLAVLRRAAVEPAASASLALSVSFGDEPHLLVIARPSCFPELDRVWDAMADIPEPVLLALVERECGPFFQFLENAVRRQLRLIGVAAPSRVDAGGATVAFDLSGNFGAEGADGVLTFSLTRSQAVVAALGVLRNIDLAHEAVRSQTLPAEVEYAAFSMPEADVASVEVGDAVLVPEVGAVEPALVVDGRFAAGPGGVSPYAPDAFVRVRAAEPVAVTLGEVFDAAVNPISRPAAAQGAQLKLVKDRRLVASGRLDKLADQLAFIVEAI